MEKIDIESLNSLPISEQIEKKMDIIKNTSLESIPLAILPETFYTDYYFVSYSHKDYVEVYSDIFNLQKEGMNIWYDRGLPAGKDWKVEASRHLVPFACKGVIFYISENSLISDAVIDEIEYALSTKKPFICIHIPFKDDFKYKGKNTNGNVYTLKEMIDIIKAKNKKAMSPEKEAKLLSLLPQEKIFLSYNIDASSKKEKIVDSMPKSPLLNGCAVYDEPYRRYRILIDSINDISALKIEERDFFDLANSLKVPSDEEVTLEFSNCCLANCANLQEIEIPTGYGIWNIGKMSFYGCKALKSFDFRNVLHIEDKAFFGCSSLVEVNIPKETRMISYDAFMDCESLKVINVDKENTKFHSDNNVLVDDYFNHITRCPNAYEGVYKITPGIKATYLYAFSKCNKLTGVIIPDSVTSLCSGCFLDSCNIKEISIPDSINEIPNSCFRGCKGLKVVKMGKGITKIDNMAFKNCSSLEKIQIGENVTYICEWSFDSCSSLEKITFNNKLEEIGSYAFKNCYSLKKVIFPNSMKKISFSAFEGCKMLEEVVFGDGIEEIPNSVFSKCPSLKKVTLGKNIKTIKDFAFSDSKQLNHVIYKGKKHDFEVLLSQCKYSPFNKDAKVECSDATFYIQK